MARSYSRPALCQRVALGVPTRWPCHSVLFANSRCSLLPRKRRWTRAAHAASRRVCERSARVSESAFEALRAQSACTDLVAYIAGVCSHPGFVRRFDEELHTPGVRVPLTKDYALWIQAVVLGRHVIWLHTYGDVGSHPDGLAGIRDAREFMPLPDYEIAVGTSMPSETSYDPETGELRLGAGMWSGVTPEVRGYTVGGTNVIDSWIGYRLKHPKGRRPSPLDKMNVTAWPNEWSIEFTNLLSVLTQLVELEQTQDELLTEILAS
ncbi:type ISP restriction/modification enzyme, partial [Mycolicibacterium thermoresistibile]